MNIVVLLLLSVMVVMLYRKHQHAVSYRVDARGRIFDECALLLANTQQRLDKANLPILEGVYSGYKVSLSIVEDTLGWRKVPPLWLLIKVEANLQSTGTLDYIVRPSNNEFYSPSWQWNGNLTIPAGWPQHAILKYQHQAVDLNLIDSFVPKLFANANMKELLVAPNFTRLTYMVKQAERGEYLIMRNAIYENTPIAKNIVETLLKQAIAIRINIENSGTVLKAQAA
ncbi:MAG: hypothetical protein PSV17_08325 [Methylotenera sp.]|uniref:hypothetical protein n=1 Tax=Methylotenera sp. TaxID=2051956 RepID=UPI0024884745|nr:hypothetical protein [Methylotenera sp.]MDI1309426.1 hypothetical protein [Methylotenera sp.]